MSEDKWVQLGTYFNNRTGFLTASMVLLNHYSTTDASSIKVVLSISPVKPEMKQAMPGSKGVYDYDKRLSFSISESELAHFVHFLSHNLNKKEFEYKFNGHFSLDKSRVSNMSIKKSADYKNVMFTIYSNKKDPNGLTVNCAVSYPDFLALYENLRSVLINSSILKLKRD